MSVTSVEITGRTPFADGQPFDGVGAYERIDGVLTLAVDPGHAANALITDLKLVPRGADGLVRFTSDFTFVAPVDRGRGNGELIVDVVNRGRRQVMPTFNLAPPSRVGSAEIPVGDGFLCRRGYSVMSVGWQWDVPRSPAMMGLDAPVAFENGIPASGQVLVEIRPDVVQKTRLLANRVHEPYPAADVDEPGARLLVKDWEDGPYTEIPRAEWRFAQEVNGSLTPSPAHIHVESGLQPGKIYHVVYTTNHAPVVGAGLLAIRDAGAHLKNASAELAPAGFEYAHAYGVSQTGRLLRHLLYLGLNVDEQGPAGVRRPPGPRRRSAQGRVQPAIRSAVGAIDSRLRPSLPLRGQRARRPLQRGTRRSANKSAGPRRGPAHRLHEHVRRVLARPTARSRISTPRDSTTSMRPPSPAPTSSRARSTR